eukprot:2342824-Amphidinium_carterae.1
MQTPFLAVLWSLESFRVTPEGAPFPLSPPPMTRRGDSWVQREYSKAISKDASRRALKPLAQSHITPRSHPPPPNDSNKSFPVSALAKESWCVPSVRAHAGCQSVYIGVESAGRASCRVAATLTSVHETWTP